MCLTLRGIYFVTDYFDDFFLGTFAPFARAFDNPIAIACSRDCTGTSALPDTAFPFLNIAISFATSSAANGLYFFAELFSVVFFTTLFLAAGLRLGAAFFTATFFAFAAGFAFFTAALFAGLFLAAAGFAFLATAFFTTDFFTMAFFATGFAFLTIVFFAAAGFAFLSAILRSLLVL